MREDFRRRMNHCRKNTNRSFCLLFVNECRRQQQWTVELINCSSLSFSSLQSIAQEWRTFNLEAGLRWAHQIWIDALQSGKKEKDTRQHHIWDVCGVRSELPSSRCWRILGQKTHFVSHVSVYSSLSSVSSHFLSCQHFMSMFCLHEILLEAEMCQQTVETHLIQTQQSFLANLALIWGFTGSN